VDWEVLKRVDLIGIGTMAVGLGLLEVVLEEGNREDWFGSSFILLMAVVSGVGLMLFVVWELLREDPIVDLRLLTNRTFAVANVLMLMLGFVLLGTTVGRVHVDIDFFGISRQRHGGEARGHEGSEYIVAGLHWEFSLRARSVGGCAVPVRALPYPAGASRSSR